MQCEKNKYSENAKEGYFFHLNSFDKFCSYYE